MHLARDEVVVRQRDPVPFTDLAGLGARGDPYWRARCGRRDVLGEHGAEERCYEVEGVRQKAVYCKRLAHGDGDWCCQGLEEVVFVLLELELGGERGVGLGLGVGEGLEVDG